MNASSRIHVLDFTDGPFAVSAEDGQRLRDRIMPLLRTGTPVTVSFAKIEVIVGAFVNAAFGPLFADYPTDLLHTLLTIQDISADDRMVVEQSIRNARAYRANSAAFDKAWTAVLGKDQVIQEATRP